MHKYKIQEHILAVHRKIKQHVCSECQTEFAYKEGMRKHMKKYHNGTIPKNIT